MTPSALRILAIKSRGEIAFRFIQCDWTVYMRYGFADDAFVYRDEAGDIDVFNGTQHQKQGFSDLSNYCIIPGSKTPAFLFF